jgi:hypothetical protein
MTEATDHGRSTYIHHCYRPRLELNRGSGESRLERIGTNMIGGSITCNLTARIGRNFNPILTLVVEKLLSRLKRGIGAGKHGA